MSEVGVNEWLTLGLYGSGMHNAVMNEVELGERVAQDIDNENNWLGSDGVIYLAFGIET